jgi:hypothetical protein
LCEDGRADFRIMNVGRYQFALCHRCEVYHYCGEAWFPNLAKVPEAFWLVIANQLWGAIALHADDALRLAHAEVNCCEFPDELDV